MRETTKEPKGRSDLVRRLAEKALMPVVAAAASAAAGYAVKKAPEFFERKVSPRLKGMSGGVGGAAQDLPARAKEAVSGAGDIPERLGDRAKAVAAGASSLVPGSDGQSRDSRRPVSNAEYERRRQTRARNRTARRKASST